MARKFKKKLALRQTRSKATPILSVGLIGKETLIKAVKTWKNITTRFKAFKLAR